MLFTQLFSIKFTFKSVNFPFLCSNVTVGESERKLFSSVESTDLWAKEDVVWLSEVVLDWTRPVTVWFFEQVFGFMTSSIFSLLCKWNVEEKWPIYKLDGSNCN